MDRDDKKVGEGHEKGEEWEIFERGKIAWQKKNKYKNI